jgi:hypothetical protein
MPGVGGSGGFGAVPGAAEDEPQLASEVPMPIATIVLNIAELPTALPTAVRNSRRRNSFRSDAMPPPRLIGNACFVREYLAKQYLILLIPLYFAALA